MSRNRNFFKREVKIAALHTAVAGEKTLDAFELSKTTYLDMTE